VHQVGEGVRRGEYNLNYCKHIMIISQNSYTAILTWERKKLQKKVLKKKLHGNCSPHTYCEEDKEGGIIAMGEL